MREAARPFRWVVFDAVGTLIHPDPPVARVYQEVGARYGGSRTEAELADLFRSTMAVRPAESQTSEDIERKFWQQTVESVIGSVRDPQACFHDLYAHFARPNSWRMADDAAAVLNHLRRLGTRIAVASNFDERLLQVLAGFPDLGRLDACVISSQVGWRKPHLKFYHAVLAATGCPAEEIVMIGDSLEQDILPARQLGMQAIHLAPPGSGSAPTVASLGELLDELHARD